jgi:heme exporter protein C
MLFKKLLSTKAYYLFTGRYLMFLNTATIILFIIGLYWSLVIAPADYQQGDVYRIIFIHVPAAWLSMAVYVIMAVAGTVTLIWRAKIAEIICVQAAPVGLSFTVIALVTGMLWGKPTWGTYWVWDARLTSELILLFLYIGVVGLYKSISDARSAARACSILSIVGVVNIPIIHFSVNWWNTLHQGATVTKLSAPSAHSSMLYPLLFMGCTFFIYFVTILFIRSRSDILKRERGKQWVQEIFNEF